MTAVLLRTIAASLSPGAGAAVAARPEDVPARVDDLTLAATLRAGQPGGAAATRDVLTVRGIGCPTVAEGRGRPILCVHGLGHDSWDWAPFFVRCTSIPAGRGARVTAIDLPGFGLSDKPAAPLAADGREGGRWDLSVLVDAVLAAADRCAADPLGSGERPVVVASSLGGHVAMLAALQRPDAFAKLLLVSPGGLVSAPSPLQALLRAYYSVEAIAGRPEGELVGNSRKIFATSAGSPAVRAVDDALAARKLAVRRSERAREFAVPFAGYVDDVFRHVVSDRLTQLRPPVAIVVGERDVVVPPDACAAAARTLSCRFHLVPNIGHTPHLEAPDAFAEAALSFALSDPQRSPS